MPEQVKKRFAAAAAMLNEQDVPAEPADIEISMSEEDKNVDPYSKFASHPGEGREDVREMADDRLSGDGGGAEEADATRKKCSP